MSNRAFYGTVDSGKFAPSKSGTTALQADSVPRFYLTGNAITAGACYAVRISLRPGAYTTVSWCVSTAATGVSNAYIALYDVTSLARLAVTSDLSAKMSPAGVYSDTLSYTVPAAGDYYLGFVVGAHSSLQLAGLTTGSSPLALLAPAVAGRHNTGSLTAAPDPFVWNSGATGVIAPWMRME